MDGRVFISRQSRHPISLINNMIKVLFPIWTLIWRVNNYVSRQRKVQIREIKVHVLLYKLSPFRYCTYHNITTVAHCFSLKITFNC